MDVQVLLQILEEHNEAARESSTGSLHPCGRILPHTWRAASCKALPVDMVKTLQVPTEEPRLLRAKHLTGAVHHLRSESVRKTCRQLCSIDDAMRCTPFGPCLHIAIQGPRMLTEKSAAGGSAAQSDAFAHPAAQTCAQPRPRPAQQERSTQSQALQEELRFLPAHGQPRTAFEDLAARTHGCQEPFPSDHAFREQCQPPHSMAGLVANTRDYHESLTHAQGRQDEPRLASPYEQPRDVFASLAARSRAHQEAPNPAAAPQEDWHHAPPPAQHHPSNTFESFAARSRHLGERRQSSSAAPRQLSPGQRVLPGSQTCGTGRLVQGLMRGPDVPQDQQSGWMGHHIPTHDPHGTQSASEPSFTFAPAGVPLQPQAPDPAQVSPHNRAYSVIREPAQQSQSQRGRLVPASCQPAAGTWQAQQHAISSQPVLQQQACTHQSAEQSSGPRAYAPPFAAEQSPHAPEGATAGQAAAHPQDQAQAEPQGFYSTWLQNLSTSMHAHAPAWPSASVSGAHITARTSVSQGPHEPGQGRPAQIGADASSIPSVPSGVHPALSRTPAPARTALPAHPPEQARVPQQGVVILTGTAFLL